jgi:proteasome beta subunit
MEEYSEGPKKGLKGTTTIGIVCSDGIIIGADSRATLSPNMDIASGETVKIFKINDNVGVTIAGYVGDAQYLVKLIKVQNDIYTMNESKGFNPTSLSSLLSLIMQENKYMPYFVELIIGGITNGVPELYIADPSGASIKYSDFYSVGSGSSYAIGYLEDKYEKGKTTQDMLKYAVKALKVAMKRNAATGDNIRIATITKAGYKEYYGSDVEKLLK